MRCTPKVLSIQDEPTSYKNIWMRSGKPMYVDVNMGNDSYAVWRIYFFNQVIKTEFLIPFNYSRQQY